MPCLISKFVLKQLGAVIDLENNHVVFKKITALTEPLHDLETGHVAIELIKDGQDPPEVDPDAIEICKNGQEVTMGNAALRQKLGHHQPSNGIHDVTWSGKSKSSKVRFQEESAEETRLDAHCEICLLYTSPSPRDRNVSRMPSSA